MTGAAWFWAGMFAGAFTVFLAFKTWATFVWLPFLVKQGVNLKSDREVVGLDPPAPRRPLAEDFLTCRYVIQHEKYPTPITCGRPATNSIRYLGALYGLPVCQACADLHDTEVLLHEERKKQIKDLRP